MWRSTTQVLLTRAKPHCCANTVRTLFTGFGPTTNQYTTKILPTPRWRTIPHRTCVRMASRVPPMSWESLEQAVPQPVRDRVNGPTNSQATLRLFGRPKEEARVVLYRDYHAWCPYCQKVGCHIGTCGSKGSTRLLCLWCQKVGNRTHVSKDCCTFICT